MTRLLLASWTLNRQAKIFLRTNGMFWNKNSAKLFDLKAWPSVRKTQCCVLKQMLGQVFKSTLRIFLKLAPENDWSAHTLESNKSFEPWRELDISAFTIKVFHWFKFLSFLSTLLLPWFFFFRYCIISKVRYFYISARSHIDCCTQCITPLLPPPQITWRSTTPPSLPPPNRLLFASFPDFLQNQ